MYMLDAEVRDFLRQYSFRLDTDAGQHFLIDEAMLQTIVEAAKLTPNEQVIEIGPGIGILTRELLAKGAAVTTIEIDPRLVPLLQIFVSNSNLKTPAFARATAGKQTSKLTIVNGNALHVPLSLPSQYKVVANIPYHITSPLLHRFLLETETLPVSLTLLIQKEVAENIASSGSPSILSVLVGLHGKARFVATVPPKAFLPPPKVDSAILHIDCYKKPLVDRETAKRVLKVGKLAMSKRRKMLSNSIGALPDGMEALTVAHIDSERRPQTLTTDEWITLEAALHTKR